MLMYFVIKYLFSNLTHTNAGAGARPLSLLYNNIYIYAGRPGSYRNQIENVLNKLGRVESQLEAKHVSEF